MNTQNWIRAALLLATSTANAQDRAVSEAMINAWHDWTEDANISASSIAVGYEGELLQMGGKRRDPTAPYPLASLTKAITAVCLRDVLAEQDLSFDMTLGALADRFQAANILIPNALANVTLGQVVTMSAGLSPDITQGQFAINRNNGKDLNIGFARRAIMEGARRGTVGTYEYNNGNYALLGALLEVLTKTENVTACRERTFPAGNRATPAFNEDWIALGAFGGWEASATDYLHFVMQAFGPDSEIFSQLDDLPRQDIGGGAFYGLGTNFRTRDGLAVFWHNGAICVNDADLDMGSYFAHYENGYVVSVNYNICGVGPAAAALDQAMWNAAHSK